MERRLWHDTKFFQHVDKIQALVKSLLDVGDSRTRKALYDCSLVKFFMNKILLGRILVDFQKELDRLKEEIQLLIRLIADSNLMNSKVNILG